MREVGKSRREFIALVSGVLAGPAMAQNEQVRRVGVLMHVDAGDSEGQERIASLRQGLQESGWIEQRNIRLDTRWAANEADRRRHAAELVASAPDMILASTTLAMVALQQSPSSIPIIFINVTDPVGAGFVLSLAKPGRNVTGFTTFDYTISVKWLEFLKEISPQLKRTVVIRDPTIASAIGQFAVIQAAATSLKIDVIPADARNFSEIENAVTGFLQPHTGGIIVTASGFGLAQRDALVSIAERHRLPAIYPFDYFVRGGGLISYGPNSVEQYRQAATYVDRILKGEKASDLPVQAPTKYQLIANLRTAKALGLVVPPTILLRAAELIE
jgi:putative tryptophan/tyrosine transport system substrate-binding protein